MSALIGQKPVVSVAETQKEKALENYENLLPPAHDLYSFLLFA